MGWLIPDFTVFASHERERERERERMKKVIRIKCSRISLAMKICYVSAAFVGLQTQILVCESN